jgi:hypothetical protein
MNTRKMRVMTVVFPVLSLIVAGGIVTHQYARRSRLAGEMARLTREIAQMERSLPASRRPVPHDHDDHDHGH